MSDSSTFPGDPFEMLKKLWAPTGLPLPGLTVPTLDPAEIDKRIADLKQVENWMNVNLNVLRMSIQTLEMQKATLAAMAAAMPSGAAKPGEAKVTEAGPPSLADTWWQMFQQMTAAAAQSAKPEAPAQSPRTEPDPPPKHRTPTAKKGE